MKPTLTETEARLLGHILNAQAAGRLLVISQAALADSLDLSRQRISQLFSALALRGVVVSQAGHLYLNASAAQTAVIAAEAAADGEPVLEEPKTRARKTPAPRSARRTRLGSGKWAAHQLAKAMKAKPVPRARRSRPSG